jgi:histidinol phosphatase-like PHP family hydrolase
VACDTKYNWWYRKQNYAHISQSLPLPADEDVKFLFGCETDLDSSYCVGLPRERWDDFDFIIVSTTHFHHMIGEEWENCTEEDLARLWVKRFEAVLNADLPFGKVGMAHLACGLIYMNNHESYLRTLDLIPTEDMQRLFMKAAKLGVGIELNYDDIKCKDSEVETVFRMFRIAKECGCKFYLGSDAHSLKAFEGVDEIFARAIDILGLNEEDKFVL